MLCLNWSHLNHSLSYLLRTAAAVVAGFSSHSSLLLGVLAAVHVAALALAHGPVHIVVAASGGACESGGPLASIPRASHHVFTERAALLDSRLEILVSLLLDSLSIL